MQVRGEQWLTSDTPTVLTADLLWADRLAQKLNYDWKAFYFFYALAEKNVSNVTLFQLYLFCSQINVCMVHV